MISDFSFIPGFQSQNIYHNTETGGITIVIIAAAPCIWEALYEIQENPDIITGSYKEYRTGICFEGITLINGKETSIIINLDKCAF